MFYSTYKPSLVAEFAKTSFRLSYVETGTYADTNLSSIHFRVFGTLVEVEFLKPQFRR